MKLLAPKWSSRMMNPNTMIKNQPNVVDREKHGRNLDNTGSIQDQTMMAPLQIVGPHHHLYDLFTIVHSRVDLCC